MKVICGEDITAVDFLEEHSEKFNNTELPFSVYSYVGFGYYSPSDGVVGIKPSCEPFNETWKDLPFNSYNFNVAYLGENYDFF